MNTGDRRINKHCTPLCVCVHVCVFLHFKQASLVSELKTWCLSKLQNMEVRFTGDPTKLRRSSSVTEGLNQADGAGLTVLPSGTHCLELHSSPGPQDSSWGEASVAESGASNHYFVVHVESSPGKSCSHRLVSTVFTSVSR